MREITFHEEAVSEMLEAALYYEQRAIDLGLAFLDEVEKTSERILTHPTAYQLPKKQCNRQLPIP